MRKFVITILTLIIGLLSCSKDDGLSEIGKDIIDEYWSLIKVVDNNTGYEYNMDYNSGSLHFYKNGSGKLYEWNGLHNVRTDIEWTYLGGNLFICEYKLSRNSNRFLTIEIELIDKDNLKTIDKNSNNITRYYHTDDPKKLLLHN